MIKTTNANANDDDDDDNANTTYRTMVAINEEGNDKNNDTDDGFCGAKETQEKDGIMTIAVALVVRQDKEQENNDDNDDDFEVKEIPMRTETMTMAGGRSKAAAAGAEVVLINAAVYVTELETLTKKGKW